MSPVALSQYFQIMRCSFVCEFNAELWGSRGCAEHAYDRFDLIDKVPWPVERRLWDDVMVVSLGWLR